MNRFDRTSVRGRAAVVVVLGLLGVGIAASPAPAPKAFGTGGLLSLEVKTSGYENSALTPDAAGWEVTFSRSSWDDGRNLMCDYDVIAGTAASGAGTKDDRDITRDRLQQNVFDPLNTAEGWVYQVKAGYGVVGGKFPVLAGRRVRGASDGTQFAIELYENSGTVKERVYFLATHSKKPVRVRTYKDENQQDRDSLNAVLNKPGDFVEISWTAGQTPTASPHTIWEKGQEDRLYFATQMMTILCDLTVPVGPTSATVVSDGSKGGVGDVIVTTVPGPPTKDHVVQRESLMARFLERFEDKQEIHTIVVPQHSGGGRPSSHSEE